MYIIRTLLKINNLSLEIWVLCCCLLCCLLKVPSVSTLLETSSVVLTLTLVFSLISWNWIVNMNLSSIDFLSRFIHGCSSELNLTKVNKSESSTVAILTSNNSSLALSPQPPKVSYNLFSSTVNGRFLTITLQDSYPFCSPDNLL